MIEIDDFSFRYPRAEVEALAGIDFTVPAGQLCAVAGANGAGKSTLCYALTGFIPHFYHGDFSGSVRVDGRDVLAEEIAALAGTVGLVFSKPFNQITGARFTVREEIAFGLENLGLPRPEMVERIDEALAVTGLVDLAGRSPYALSGGQQQRLAIASVLAMKPQVLVLDEPTSQLDPVGTREIFALLRRLVRDGETAVVVSTHELEWAAVYADRLLILDRGRLAADGAPAALLAAAGLVDHGLRPTRYTQAARLAVEQGLAPSGRPLPVTLEQAREFFR